MKYVAGHFEKGHEEGFYNTLASVAGSDFKILKKYLLRDLSDVVISKLKKSDNPDELANELEIAYKNLDKNVTDSLRDMIFDAVHWHLDLMHSFSPDERSKYYDHLRQSLIPDKSFLQKVLFF